MTDTWTRNERLDGWSVACPACGKTMTLAVNSVEDTVGATFDCPGCGTLLINDPEAGVTGLHALIHASEPSWPADGAGTGYIEMREKMTDLGLGK